MCGRFTQHHSWAEIHDGYDLIRPEDQRRNTRARYNIAPTQDVLCVATIDGARRLFEARWWLVPHWAREIQNKYPMFNAKSEEAHNKPAFRDALKWGRRCLIPADGYYEWMKSPEDGGKDPHYVHLPEHEHFAFAGIWSRNEHVAWKEQTGVTSCTILTAPAVPEIAHLHARMPIILKREVWEAWLDPATTLEEARKLYFVNLGTELVSYRVDRAVNSSRAEDSQALIEPV